MAKLNIDYDKENDVMYVMKGNPCRTMNITVDDDIVLRFHQGKDKVLGLIITNFNYVYPKLAKCLDKKSIWFIEEHFEHILKDFNCLIETITEKKVLIHSVKKLNRVYV